VIDHAPSHRALRTERAVLAALGGSCTVPVAAYAEPLGPGGIGETADGLRATGLVASGDGRTLVRLSREGDDPERLGTALAHALLEGGGAAIDGFADAPAARDAGS
jgi:hydroxymethylbilane synthase